MLVGTGKIEGGEHSRNSSALDVTINCPARNCGAGSYRKGHTADLVFQLTRRGKDGVAKALNIETLPVHSPQQLILGILLPRFGIVRAALLVSGRKHDSAMQFLERPAGFHEVHGQIVE